MDRVKTSINIDDGPWRKFSVRVIEEGGGRHKNDIAEERKYLKER